MSEQKVRMLNGYRVIYYPEHPRAMSSDNWRGFVYEHIAVAEKYLGRAIRNNEVVHHLDQDRANNRHENLLVIERTQHRKLHVWLEAGAPGAKASGVNGVNSGNANAVEQLYCKVCEAVLQDKQKECCSDSCAKFIRRKVERPSAEQLAEDIRTLSWLAIGRKYGVSDNAARKWARKYGLLSPTLSQAACTQAEGAETSGEV